MKKPEECENIDDVRLAIDTIDKNIIQELSKRYLYVKEAAKYKKTTTDVKASDRVKSMLEKRRHWAIENDLSPDVIENMFKSLVEYFIDREMQEWNK